MLSIDNTENISSHLEEKDEISFQEIIESYSAQGPFVFQIEGNFTSSGNREIIAFYRSYGLGNAFCFVLDSSGEKIENVYTINYFTVRFNQLDEADSGLIEAVGLGREIIWRDYIIGRVGDFNNNGRDELYLFYISGMDRGLRFFEFDGAEFVEIIEYEWGSEVTIADIDPENSIITLKITNTYENMNFHLSEKLVSYIWDESVQRYVILSSSELKYFRWNRNLQRYEEIEG